MIVMKLKYIWMAIWFLQIRSYLNAQDKIVKDSVGKIEVTCNKTLSLVFPDPVTHIDRGTADLLVQSVQEARNIVLVKARHPFFYETNLTVVTSQGRIYAFKIIFDSLA